MRRLTIILLLLLCLNGCDKVKETFNADAYYANRGYTMEEIKYWAKWLNTDIGDNHTIPIMELAKKIKLLQAQIDYLMEITLCEKP